MPDRGVWKAPAGVNAGLTGDSGLQYTLTDAENGNLNPQAINCLRHFKVYGNVVWGARTLAGSDAAGSQWKYVPIRRTALYIESSLLDGTQWVVFEPNDETLWGQIRLNVGAFMQGLFLRAPSRAPRRSRPISSNATPTTIRRPASPSASSTSSSASRRSIRPNSSSSRSSRSPPRRLE